MDQSDNYIIALVEIVIILYLSVARLVRHWCPLRNLVAVTFSARAAPSAIPNATTSVLAAFGVEVVTYWNSDQARNTDLWQPVAAFDPLAHGCGTTSSGIQCVTASRH